MISLNGLALSDSLIWSDRYVPDVVAQSTRRSLGGSVVVFTGPLTAGFPITLTAVQNFGWFTKAQVDALVEMAKVVGGVFPLVYGSAEFSVMFRHESPPALDIQPLLARQTPFDSDHFIGSLKLMAV